MSHRLFSKWCRTVHNYEDQSYRLYLIMLGSRRILNDSAELSMTIWKIFKCRTCISKPVENQFNLYITLFELFLRGEANWDTQVCFKDKRVFTFHQVNYDFFDCITWTECLNKEVYNQVFRRTCVVFLLCISNVINSQHLYISTKKCSIGSRFYMHWLSPERPSYKTRS